MTITNKIGSHENPQKKRSSPRTNFCSFDGVRLHHETPTRLGNRRSNSTEISMSPLSRTTSLSLEMTFTDKLKSSHSQTTTIIRSAAAFSFCPTLPTCSLFFLLLPRPKANQIAPHYLNSRLLLFNPYLRPCFLTENQSRFSCRKGRILIYWRKISSPYRFAQT